MKKINIKTTIFLLLLLFMTSGVLLIPAIAKTELKTSQPVVIDIVVTDEQFASVTAGLNRFQESPLSNGIDAVNIISSGSNADQQLAFLQTRLAAGDTTLDVIGLDVVWTAQFAANGWIINLSSSTYLGTSYDMSIFIGGMADSCIYKDSIYALPWFFNLGVLYYRRDLMEQNGFTLDDIDTWAELNATANTILAANSSDISGLVGFTAQMANYEGGTVNFIEWIGANGATEIVDAQGDFNVTKSEIVDAMTFLKALIAPAEATDLATTDYIISREILTSTEAESGDKWLDGEAIFVRQWPYIYDLSLESSDPIFNTVDGDGLPINWGITGIPTFDGTGDQKSACVGGQILSINSKSPYKQAALNVTRYLCEDNFSQYQPLKEYSHPPALKETYQGLPTNLLFAEAFFNASDVTLARPIFPKYSLVSDVISDSFSAIISCQTTPQAGLTTMQNNIESVLTVVPDVIPGFMLPLGLLIMSSMISLIIIVQRKRLNKK
ncbi:MAG: extracellular solute-binding protein [Candidatus Lokiarchaeota archaeon]|nr:extracellular solute-binding protein [Candidatus Lokiarchaeota archaeon]